MSINWNKSIGQLKIKESLSKAIENNQIGHAYLFTGKPGLGKLSIALEFAMALLCESDTNKPCYSCPSCKKILSHSHPDFRFLSALPFSKEHRQTGNPQKLNDKGWEYINSSIKDILSHPYKVYIKGNGIPVEWIREMNNTINRGSSNSYTVVILDGVERLRVEAANAMLKTLEEPPKNTVIILLAESIEKVLPTIKSRCQIYRFGAIEEASIQEYLQQHFPEKAEEIERVIPLSYGSLGKAIELINEENNKDLTVEFSDIIFGNYSKLERLLTYENFIADNFDKEFDTAIKVIESIVEELRISFLNGVQSKNRYIFSETASTRLAKCSSNQIYSLFELLQNSINSLKKHTSTQMVLIDVMLEILEIIDE